MYRVFAVNPGSTSTKIALLDDDQVLFSRNVAHEAETLAKFPTLADQRSYREETILSLLRESDVSLEGVDAFVCQGGGIFWVDEGVYEIDALVLEHARTSANGVIHPACLGPGLCHQLKVGYGGVAFMVYPPDVDELQDLARMTGIKGVYRQVRLHTLNLKETARRHAASLGRRYEDCNFVVCHLGGGISVSAHRRGRMVDGFNIAGGDGPMAPTRCGSIAVADLLRYAQGKDVREVLDLTTKSGGFVSHLGVSDSREVTERAATDKYARMVWDTAIYQIEKSIGAMAAVLHGEVDGILLGGGMAHSEDLVGHVTEACSFIAPVTAYPGEFEMEGMGAATARVLSGQEPLKKYTGKPVWTGFDFEPRSET